MLIFSLDIFSQRFKNWKNLTHDNIENYFLSYGYNLNDKYQEGKVKIYEGIKIKDKDKSETLAIVFKNQVVSGLSYYYISHHEFNKIEGLNIDFSRELFKEVVSDAKNRIKNEGGYKIISDNDFKFETEFKKLDDGKIKKMIIRENVYGNRYKINFQEHYILDEISYEIGGVNILDVDTYNLEEMVQFFLRDLYFFSQKYEKQFYNLPNSSFYEDEIIMEFTPLDGNVIALAYGYNVNDKILIGVDPDNWGSSSLQERWYVLYHELGHDKLNFLHGQGGKMMFNYVSKNYTWDEFFNDRKIMFENYFKGLSK